MYGLHCVFDGVFHIGISEPQRLPGTRKLQKRVDEVSHLIHCDTNFLIEFLALLIEQACVLHRDYCLLGETLQ